MFLSCPSYVICNGSIFYVSIALATPECQIYDNQGFPKKLTSDASRNKGRDNILWILDQSFRRPFHHDQRYCPALYRCGRSGGRRLYAVALRPARNRRPTVQIG